MVERGIYKVIQHLNISHSLLSQVETEPSHSKNDMHKALLERDLKHTVVYFADQINFGPNAEIRLLHDIKFPIIFKEDYQIVKKTLNTHNIKLIQKLLHKD